MEASSEAPTFGAFLEPGPWTAAGEASGRAVGSQDGVTGTWEGTVPAQWDFVISKTADDAGVARGTWRHQGSAVMTFVSPLLPGPATATVEFSGEGEVGGTGEELLLTGTTRTTGFVTVPGQSFNPTIDNQSALPLLTLRVSAVSCNQAFGQWVYTIGEVFEDAGFTPSFSGSWVGTREVEAVSGEIGAMIDAARGTDLSGPAPTGGNEFARLTTVLLQTYNTMIESFPTGWSNETVFQMLDASERYLNSWRNLTACLRELFGDDNVETFISGLTLAIQGLILTGLSAEPLTSETWSHLAHAAIRTGAIGAGALNPAAAADAEQALIDAGEFILEANVDPADGKVFINDDTVRVMSTGAQMGWTYFVNGEAFDARARYNQAFGSPGTAAGDAVNGGEG